MKKINFFLLKMKNKSKNYSIFKEYFKKEKMKLKTQKMKCTMLNK